MAGGDPLQPAIPGYLGGSQRVWRGGFFNQRAAKLSETACTERALFGHHRGRPIALDTV